MNKIGQSNHTTSMDFDNHNDFRSVPKSHIMMRPTIDTCMQTMCPFGQTISEYTVCSCMPMPKTDRVTWLKEISKYTSYGNKIFKPK